MASFEFTEAQKLQNPLLQSEVLHSIITADHMLEAGVLPFVDTGGRIEISYNRVNSYGSQDATFIASTGSVTHSAATFTNVTGRVVTIAKQFRVPNQYSADPVFAAEQTNLAANRVGAAFSEAFSLSAAPSDTTLQFTGLGGLISINTAQTVSADDTSVTGVISFAKLDELSDAVKETGQKVYLMPSRTIRSYRALLRSAGVSVESITLPEFGRPVLSHNGIPIFKNDYMDTDLADGGGTNTSRVYCFLPDPVRGVHGFYNGAGAIQVLGPYAVPATISQEYSVEMNVGIALKSTLAAAQLIGVTD